MKSDWRGTHSRAADREKTLQHAVRRSQRQPSTSLDSTIFEEPVGRLCRSRGFVSGIFTSCHANGMSPKRLKTTLLNVVLAALFTASALQPSQADEGMWTFDNFPAAKVRQLYGVDITPAWLDSVRLATVRLANCTASFVSPDGLILTNHHCAAECLAQQSTPGHDRLRDGYAAPNRTAEPRCPTQRADVLVAMENITAKVTAATTGLDDKAANDARRKTLTALEQTCEQSAAKAQPLKCESVTLYQGGQYWLYKYRRYSDVRLVFAPEEAIAAFGGDPDNFQFPRWCLDMLVAARLRERQARCNTRTFLHDQLERTSDRRAGVRRRATRARPTDCSPSRSCRRTARRTCRFWLLRYSELRGR